MKNEKEYNKLYQRELYKKQREIKTYCEICDCKLISHFLNKHTRTKKHQLNFLKIENEKLINMLSPQIMELDSEALEIIN